MAEEENYEETGDPVWDGMKPTERKQLLDEVFQDDDWYDGTPYYSGGQSNPAFDEISRPYRCRHQDGQEVLRRMAKCKRSGC